MMEAKQGTLTMIILAFIPFVMVLGNSMLVPVLPTMKTNLDLTEFQVSLTITIFSLSAGLVIPFIGYVSDHVRRKWVIVLALVIYGAGGLISGFAAWFMDNSYIWILIGRLIQGIGAAGTSPIAMALIGDLFSGAQESKALGIIESSNGLGKILSPIIGSLIALITWFAVFFAFPALCFANAIFVWFFVKEKAKAKGKPFPEYIKSLKQIFKQEGKWLIPAFFVGTVGLFILFGVLFYLSDVLEASYNIDGVLKGCILAIPLLGMVITAYITGAKIKMNKPLMRRIIIIGMLLLTGSMLAVSFFQQIYLMVGCLTLGSIGTGFLLPCLNTLITGAVGKAERGMITSLYGSIRFLGVAFGPPLFSWLMKISHRVIFFSMTGLCLVTLLIAFFFIKPSKSKQGETKQGKQAPTLFKKVGKLPT